MDQEAFRLRRLVAAMLVGTLTSAAALGQTASRGDLREQALNAPSEVEVFIRLGTPSVAEFNLDALRTRGAVPNGEQQRAQAARVTAEQARFRGQLSAYGATELSSQRVGANGFRVRISADRVDGLRNLPGVRSVGRVETHHLDNVDSVPWIGAGRFWEAYGLTGEGVTVGIIDTGIDYLHANFGGPGTTGAYAANDKNVIEPGTFPTAKVVGGYDFAGATYNANVPGSEPEPDDDPLDGNGHGSHVAGTAGGLGVPGLIGPGVAPGVKLYALKVFGDVAGSTNVTSLAIEWAMDPNGDGDMSDHLDVINMSLGSAFGSPDDPSAISANNAAQLGIIVATSAGNEGNTPYVTGAPGVASFAISTAASTPGGRLYGRFRVTAPAANAGTYPSAEGAGPVTFAQTGPISGPLVLASPVEGCTPLTNAAQISGNIAFIRRGVCNFLVKYQMAQAAGARALVVYNDGLDATRIDPIVMGGLDASVTIPGLMISSTVGNVLAAATGVQVTLDAVDDPAAADRIADFSSRGPGHGGSTFKPDLTAPGVAIISTGVGSGTGSANLQGTSMAAPHTAGAAALLHQQRPGLGQAAIKALLQNSTVDVNDSSDTSVARQGVGALRVDAAAALTSYAAPAGVSFGRLNPTTPVQRQENVTLTNLGNSARTYTVEHVPGQTYPGVSVTCPSSVSVPKNKSKDFKIRLNFDPSVAITQDVFDSAQISQSEVDGWCILSDGVDSLRVAYIAVVDPASKMGLQTIQSGKAVRVRNTGPSVGIAQGFTWVKDDGENHAVEGKAHGIYKVGFRAGDPNLYFGDPVMELAIATDAPWEHISALRFDIYIDVNNDGVEDVRLVAADRSVFQDVDPGQFVTAQFDIGGAGNLDWLVLDWDFNDRVAILPFTRVGGFLGRVPEKFKYRLVVTGRDDTTDQQRDTIDFAKEVVTDLNAFALDPGGSADVNVTQGSGYYMYLFPNNPSASQAICVDTLLKAPAPAKRK